VPTSSIWLNLVERWFGLLTSRRIRRGSFGSVEDLQKAIGECLAAWNEAPNPSSGRPLWNLSSRNFRAVGKPWKRSTPTTQTNCEKIRTNSCPVICWTLE
jgi:hypothetical protein